MTATTSKLGADMTDEQILAVVDECFGRAHYEMDNREWICFARALLARQPAAIDKGTVLSYCPSQFGKQPHAFNHQKCGYCGVAAPLANEASKPAPLVEQDERGAFEEWARDEGMDLERGIIGAGAYNNASTQACWRGWKHRARAASTSANVAQGAEAEAAVPKPAMERAFSSEAMGRRDELALSDRHAETPKLLALLGLPLIDSISLYDVRVKLERALAAPPAQTALTDDVLMQAIADTAARGHVWASRALSNFRAAVREALRSPNDA